MTDYQIPTGFRERVLRATRVTEHLNALRTTNWTRSAPPGPS